jgi:2-keto-3-deoxy-6-phosphogluconate aldolase
MNIPDIVKSCSGIKVAGQVLKTFVFSTDVAIIRNNDAEGIISVYPFAPQALITQALILAAYKPIFVGIGGGTDKLERTVKLAEEAESNGAMGVVINSNSTNELIKKLKATISIPVILTMVSLKDDIKGRIESGVDIFNVSGAEKTSEIIKKIRFIDQDISIMATGGNSEKTIKMAIEAGANAISFTPPSTGELFRDMMTKYRND